MLHVVISSRDLLHNTTATSSPPPSSFPKFHASDITSLNSVLPSLLTGGLEGEDDRDLGPDTFRHTFSLCQLALQYLAHVQEDLLRQNRDLKVCCCLVSVACA